MRFSSAKDLNGKWTNGQMLIRAQKIGSDKLGVDEYKGRPGSLQHS